MIVIAIISDPKKLSGKLAAWATGSPAYHIAFVDLGAGKMYDMNLLFRRRLWPHYDDQYVKLYQCPVPVTSADLEHELDTSEDWYGVFDYLAFVGKKIFSKFNPSFKGAICSEKVESILLGLGWGHKFDSTPSPADFESILTKLEGAA